MKTVGAGIILVQMQTFRLVTIHMPFYRHVLFELSVLPCKEKLFLLNRDAGYHGIEETGRR